MALIAHWQSGMAIFSSIFHVAVALVASVGILPATAAADANIRIVVLGDSLSAGYGLAVNDAFPAQLENALRSRGHRVEIMNAGVSGDTSAGGLARVHWSVPEETDAVIVELGANDALRGMEPEATQRNLDHIIKALRERGLPILLAGMLAPPNLGAGYGERFNSIYPSLADKHEIVFYPFFLQGVAGIPDLNQEDAMHPTREGVEVIVNGILPYAEKLLELVPGSRGRTDSAPAEAENDD